MKKVAFFDLFAGGGGASAKCGAGTNGTANTGGGGGGSGVGHSGGATGGSGIVIVKQLNKAPGMWNLKTHYKQKRANLWTF